MPEIGGLPKRLSEAVEVYVGRRSRQDPVSLRQLVDATNYMMPELGLTEKELADLVAAKLVALGCNINFDMSEIASESYEHDGRLKRVRSPAPTGQMTSRSQR